VVAVTLTTKGDYQNYDPAGQLIDLARREIGNMVFLGMSYHEIGDVCGLCWMTIRDLHNGTTVEPHLKTIFSIIEVAYGSRFEFRLKPEQKKSKNNVVPLSKPRSGEL
jgi:hypothetical protein